MSKAYTRPTTELSHSEVLRLSQKAPEYLEQQANVGNTVFVPFPASETSEIWNTYEQLLFSSLWTRDDRSAHQCLERLTTRFGATNERMMGLYGLYREATAEDETALELILKEYEQILVDDSTNMPIAKRRIKLLQSLSRPIDAITALVQLLSNSPTDIESWAELSDLYLAQGFLPQAKFCLEEILLVAPNAWNIHARLAEMSYRSSFETGNANEISRERSLIESIHRYCRSIELCDGYFRGYCGLKLATDRLLDVLSKGPSAADSNTKPAADKNETLHLSCATVEVLNEKATSWITKVVRRGSAGEIGFMGYDDSEAISAMELLNRSFSKTRR